MAGDLLDSIEFTGTAANTVFIPCNKTFCKLLVQAYRLFMNYRGIGGDTRIAIDQFTVSPPLYCIAIAVLMRL